MLNPLTGVAPAKAGPTSRASRVAGPLAAAAAVAAGLALVSPSAILPARAEVAVAPDSIETPYGRAPLTFADILEKVRPAVVSVSVASGGGPKLASKEKGGRRLPEGMPDIPEDNPLYDFFFKNFPKEFKAPQQDRPVQGQGSGFVISSDGYVVTNNHVVDGANKIQVSFDDQEKYDAELIGTDPRTDLALLKIKSDKSFPSVKFTEKPIRVGDWALAVGNPFGLGGTVTAGIVSALGRDINPGPYDFIQIDAAVNRGNSGGPTFNLNGEVIGVNTAIYSPSGGNVGIAFAVPARTAMDVIDQLKNKGSVSRGWLGVKIQNVDEDTVAALGLPDVKGALVTEVTKDGPAAKSGIQVQDTIVSVNGDKVNDSKDLARKIADIAPDTSVEVKVWRGKSEQSVNVKLGMFPGSSEEIARLEGGEPGDEDGGGRSTEIDELGIKLAPVKGQSDEEGVTISDVANNSDAAEKNVKSGDVILKVDGEDVTSPEDVKSNIDRVVKEGKKAVMVQIKSGDQRRVVALKFGKQG